MGNNKIINFEVTKEQANGADTLKFYGTKELAQIMGCSIPTAREIMHRTDFPLIKVGKNYKVSSAAFEKWAMEKRL